MIRSPKIVVVVIIQSPYYACFVPEPGPLEGTPARWKPQSNSCARGSLTSSVESEGVAPRTFQDPSLRDVL